MHGLQACLLKDITVAAFRIYAQRGEDVAKKEIMEKSWNCVFEFLWEA